MNPKQRMKRKLANAKWERDVAESRAKRLAMESEEALEALRDLAMNHIELVKTPRGCYFRIKGSKGKEKSWTSYYFLKFWEKWFTPVEEKE